MMKNSSTRFENNKYKYFFTKSDFLKVRAVVLCSLFFVSSFSLAEEGATLAPFFQEHCISCHGPEKEKGDLRIDQLSGSLNDFESLEHLQNILDEITIGSMPPEDKPRPSDKELTQAVELLTGHLNEASGRHSSGGGRPVRRLTKIEYQNTVHDLLGVNINAESLPDDNSIGGFDTNAQSLYTTDLYFESYLAVARGAVIEFIESRGAKKGDEKETKSNGKKKSGVIERYTSSKSYHFFESFGMNNTSSAASEALVFPILKEFVELMNRGRVADLSLVEGLKKQFSAGRQRGEPFWEAIVEPMALSMCTIESMFHFENKDPRKKTRFVSAVELSNRLSYFLWRSCPDEELVKLAQNGGIYDANIRGQQIERMMKDEKFDRFIQDFSNQWLELERQDGIAVDDLLFSGFDSELKGPIKEETVQFMSHVIKNDLPLGNLIDSDFVLVNSALAKHYGLPKVKGDQFRVVKLPAKSRRGGLLTQAGILMQTGTGDRTSIVERGVFISKKMLNADPPPPPPLVDELPSDAQSLRRMTGAELVRKHASSAQCATCHSKIDPLGIGLEEFDAIGIYRTKDVRRNPDFEKQSKKDRKSRKNLTFEVDLETTGRMFNGERFNGSEGLKKALLQNQKRLAEAYIEAIFALAIGRDAGIGEKLTVEEIITQTVESQYPARSILKAIVESEVFKTN